MKKGIRDHFLFHATQQEIAEFMDVDRTTIRNWCKQGMPFKPGPRGSAGEYNASIVLYWWAAMLLSNDYELPRMTPCQRLAVARAYVDRCHRDSRAERVNRSEFPACFRNMAGQYFPNREVENAIVYAQCVFDMKFSND